MLDGQTEDMLIRLLIATILGGLIGIERGRGDRPAGMRTHILVCTGSALLMLVSIYGIGTVDRQWDAARIAAQVVSGIGFLGAGTIIHEGLSVRGLTTAASLWMVAAIGLAVGCGMITIAVITTIITLITLITLHNFEKRFVTLDSVERHFLRVVAKNTPNSMINIMDYLQDAGVKVRTLNIKSNTVQKTIVLELALKVTKDKDLDKIIAGLNDKNEVVSLEHVR
ncbi:MAG: MgtC/SapB family protein [Acidaminococcaceae bacterium]|jgi:putative Mg2+ transporter-C (MgtC) family protein|nr:MgtC/SapB family protein [Acidaminococcaceae bacterium]MCI2109788.1 MgtC/SapB family protein [Acidaminococcaceae bacterium]